LAIGVLDIVLTLPFGLASILTTIELARPLPFYPGWTFVHTVWQPFGQPYDADIHCGFWYIFSDYFQCYSGIVLRIVIFALFGLTKEARATYWHGICAIPKFLGWRQAEKAPCAEADERRFNAAHVSTNISYVLLIAVRYHQTEEFNVCHRFWPSFVARREHHSVSADVERG
jgi:hypothetical protein